MVVCGLALAVIFERQPEEFDSIDIPHPLVEWLCSALAELRRANINECVHAGVEPPSSIVIRQPAPSGCLYGWVGWELVLAGDSVDLVGRATAKPHSDLTRSPGPFPTCWAGRDLGMEIVAMACHRFTLVTLTLAVSHGS